MTAHINHHHLKRALKTLGKKEFDVWLHIAGVKLEIANTLSPHARNVKPRWVDGSEDRATEGYGASLLVYMDVVNEARVHFHPFFEGLGQEISALHRGLDWRDHQPLVQLRQELVHTAQELRHNPEKGPGMAFFNPVGELITYTAGSFWRPEVPFSHDFQADLLESYTRRVLAICGERSKIAELAGVNYPEWDPFVADLSQKTTKQLSPVQQAKAFMIQHSADIVSAASHADALQGSTLQISIKVCGSCLPAVLNAGVQTIITDTDAGSNGIRHIRQASMNRMTENLPAHVAYMEIERQVPIKLTKASWNQLQF